MASRIASLTTPTVYVVDNDRILRESLAWLLEPAGFAVRTFASGEDFLDACTPEATGCAVLDVRLPGISGVALQDELGRRGVGLPVIIITAYADVPLAVRALKAGALDVLEKPFPDEVIVERVGQAMALDVELRRQALERAHTAELLGRLTTRERAVFNLVIHGKANKVVAYDLGISEKTVETHRARVMQKLEARSLADLVRVGLLAEQSRTGLGRAWHPAVWQADADRRVPA